MHPLDKAERIIRGVWPKKGSWIYESPDRGRTVYRRASTFKHKQLIYNNGEKVADDETLDREYFEVNT